MIKTIKQVWSTYAEDIVPADAPPVQMQETRRAFYAGAHGLLSLVLFDISELPEDQGAAALERIRLELIEFYKDIQRGKA